MGNDNQGFLGNPWAPARRINNTPQGEATEGNAADDSLMVDQVEYKRGLTCMSSIAGSHDIVSPFRKF